MDIRDLLQGVSPLQRWRVLSWLSNFFRKEWWSIEQDLKAYTEAGSAGESLRVWMAACKGKHRLIEGIMECDRTEEPKHWRTKQLEFATFFFPMQVSQSVATLIANEVGERCATDAQISVREGNGGWFFDVKAKKIREPNKRKIYPFLYGVEFALKTRALQ